MLFYTGYFILEKELFVFMTRKTLLPYKNYQITSVLHHVYFYTKVLEERGLSYTNVYLRMRESRFSVSRQCRTIVNNKVNKNGRC